MQINNKILNKHLEEATFDTRKRSFPGVSGPMRAGKVIEFNGFISKTQIFHWAHLLSWVLGSPKKETKILMNRLLRLWNKNGVGFLCKYTKECSRIMRCYLAGILVRSSEGIPVSLVGGLPRIIPGPYRSLMRSGDFRIIRLVLSIFQIYRVLRVPGHIKLETITQPFTGLSESLPLYEIKLALNEICNFSGKVFSTNLFTRSLRLIWSVSAGPNSSVSLWGYFRDLKAWTQNPQLVGKLERMILKFSNGRDFWNGVSSDMEVVRQSIFWSKRNESSGFVRDSTSPTGKREIFRETDHMASPRLGKLSIKEEAAGKVRVFAITDCITQSVMKPLHDVLFDILRSIPQDGTFDQSKPWQALTKAYLEGHVDGFWSYDLSAATDRLPVEFQKDVLHLLTLDREYSDLWRQIMTDRDWYFQNNKYSPDPTLLRYSVGQPMGALSSWAMLAISHHGLVRIAARRVGIMNFQHYALLGDDIVIGNESVANSYFHLLTTVLGVEINLSKSLISRHVFEFAKRIVFHGTDLSPVGPKALLLCLKTMNGIPSLLYDIRDKGFYLDEQIISQMFSRVPFYSRKSQAHELQWVIKGPFGFVPTVDRLTSGYRNVSALTTVRLNSLIDSITAVKHDLLFEEWSISLKKLVNSYAEFMALSHVETPGDLSPDITKTYFWSALKEMYSTNLLEMIKEKPIRRFFFNGPLIMFGFTRPNYGVEVMEYIVSLINPPNEKPFQRIDPFAEEKVYFPLSVMVKQKNFFRLVRDREREKDRLQMLEDT